MNRILALALCCATAGSFGAVTGKVSEKLGTEWKVSGFQRWVALENALLTPEATNLALQYCLRTTQEALDAPAYDEVAAPLVAEMKTAFEKGGNSTEAGLQSLAGLLEKISAIELPKDQSWAQNYEKACAETVKPYLESNARSLYTIYEGRMAPKISKDLPAETARKLAELAKRGVRVAPLRFDGLQEQICKLEGYYSTSLNPKLWKLFSITRAMSNVLPSQEREAEFVKALADHKDLTDLVGTLNRYSAVAGKPNGPSIGMTAEELRMTKAATPVRMTGVALGTSATALMAFYTTAWREKLQDLVLQAQYPEKPFELISARQILRATELTQREIGALKEGEREAAQTEVGMSLVWNNIFDFHVVHVKPADRVYGALTASYKDTAALAWLALNAETNIRQNEKIGGIERTSVPSDSKTTLNLYADEASYQLLLNQIEAAKSAYSNLEASEKHLASSCLPEITAFAEAAVKASKDKDKTVVKLDPKSTALFGKVKHKHAFEFKPVIADIGSELKGDEPGVDGQKDFNLHLATGAWRTVPVTVDGKEYLAGTPSAFVLHLPKTTSTAEWQKMVWEKDKP